MYRGYVSVRRREETVVSPGGGRADPATAGPGEPESQGRPLPETRVAYSPLCDFTVSIPKVRRFSQSDSGKSCQKGYCVPGKFGANWVG